MEEKLNPLLTTLSIPEQEGGRSENRQLCPELGKGYCNIVKEGLKKWELHLGERDE